ncbi:hypothetical protein [Bacillus sp. FJAT-27264]|uniref:hypothetical protein n=1 Tax=Paenibacillus sp. (strain DSM 101736 / FJAT-27264) TaxID=1850362 RepID=UPI001111E534|nr:hypothetical protein [Bacillus sp. FJAT-27264]
MKTFVQRERRHKLPAPLLLLLCLGLVAASFGFPSQLAATGSRISVVQAVSQEVPPIFRFQESSAPVTLEDFAQSNIIKLAEQAPFKEWAGAKPQYYPLGPGTHGWLVNVMNGKQRIGYMIISAAEDGGYVLSEYGAGTYGLPYSLSELHRLLVQQGLISSTYSGTLELTALYAPLLPVWKLKIDGKLLFIDAAAPQILPWTLSQAENALKNTTVSVEDVTSKKATVPRTAYRTGGTDDPYADLLWLTSPKLAVKDADSFTAEISPGVSLVFQAAGRNDLFGAPFTITGYQSWQPAENTTDAKTTLYAATGAGGKRYLPLSVLIQSGTLHKLPGKHTASFN